MIELLLCLAIVVFLALQPELRALARAIGGPRRILVGLLLAAMLAGHLWHESKDTFPFVAWDLYAERAGGDPVFHRYRVRHASGRIDELSGYAGTRRLSPALHQRLQGLAHDDDAASATMLDTILRALATSRAAADDDVDDDPPAAIEIWRATVTLHDAHDPTHVREELVRTVALR